MATTPEEEEIIKKRFLTQTTTTRGDPPIRRLAQRYLAFTKALADGDSDKAAEHQAGLLRDLTTIQFGGEKAAATCTANSREQASYVEKRAALMADIAQAHEDIAKRKEELVAARIQKSHNEEYEALRRMIMKHPRRAVSIANAEAVQREIESIEAEGVAIGHLIDRRRKQLREAFVSLDQLAASFEAEEGNGSGNGAAPMAVG